MVERIQDPSSQMWHSRPKKPLHHKDSFSWQEAQSCSYDVYGRESGENADVLNRRAFLEKMDSHRGSLGDVHAPGLGLSLVVKDMHAKAESWCVWQKELLKAYDDFFRHKMELKMTKFSMFSIIFGLMFLGAIFFLTGFVTAIAVYETNYTKKIDNRGVSSSQRNAVTAPFKGQLPQNPQQLGVQQLPQSQYALNFSLSPSATTFAPNLPGFGGNKSSR